MANAIKCLFPLWFVLLVAVVDSASADPPGQPGIRLSASATGVRRYTPGKWSSLAVQGVNSTDDDKIATLAVYFNKETQHQFARRMWVPKKSMRTTWLPARAPHEIDPQRWSFDMTMLPLIESTNRELLSHRAGEELLRSLPLLADKEAIKTAAIFRRAMPDGQGRSADLDTDAYEMLATARQFAEYSRVILEFSDDFVPPLPAMWETLDQLVLCGNRIVKDSAGLAVLRDWLFRGGRLCVFLDRTSPETVATILGHASSFHIVDRVELDDFTIEDRTQPQGHNAKDRRRFESPVEFVRVVAEGADVHAHIDGWPAAFWRPAGDGEVLFITLAPDGWRPAPILPGWESIPENQDPAFRGQTALNSLGMRLFQRRSADPSTNAMVKPILQEQIGYRIPSRALATGLLGLNGFGLVVGGLWLARRNQLDRLALLLPILASATTIVFLLIGSFNNRSIPPSIAFAQLVQSFPDISSAHVSGMAAMYQQQNSDLQIAGGMNGLLLPLTKPADGTTHRLLWTDSDDGHWLNVSLPAGSVQFATFDQSIRLAGQVSVSGQFGRQGFVGHFPATAMPNVSDALIASLPSPSLGVRIQSDGSFIATPQDVFSAGQFLAGTVVSDASRRRQEVYRSLLTPRDDSRFATQPTLFVWAEPQAGVLSVPADIVQRGSSLAAIPLWIERTPPATDFTIPATFLRIASVTGEKGRSLAYNARNGKWIANASRLTNTRLRFELPTSVLPCRVTQAHLTIKLNAPSRELLIHGIIANKDSLIQRIANPSGVYQVSVDRPEWLTIDDRGGVTFSFVITESEQERVQQEDLDMLASRPVRPRESPSELEESETSARPTSFTTWDIEYVRLDVRGTTL